MTQATTARTIDTPEFHALLLDYRAAPLPRMAQQAYEAIVSHINAALSAASLGAQQATICSNDSEGVGERIAAAESLITSHQAKQAADKEFWTCCPKCKGDFILDRDAGTVCAMCDHGMIRYVPLAAPAATAEPKVPEGFEWPEPPASKGQSHVLFDDGYVEGWAKAIDTVRKMLAAAPTTQPVSAAPSGALDWPHLPGRPEETVAMLAATQHVSAPSAQEAKDAARYRWLCENNFDRQSVQIHTWHHWYEPHSVTGEPTEWKARVRGGALDRIIDAAMSTSPTSTGAAKADGGANG